MIMIPFILGFDVHLIAAHEPEKTNIRYLEALQDPGSYKVIEEILKKYWTISNLPVEKLSTILGILKSHLDESEFAIHLILKKFPDLTNKSSAFYENYRSARRERIKMFSDLLVPYVRGSVIADVGGGDASMIEFIIEQVPTIEKAYVTDVVKCQNKINNSKVEFILQKSAENTSLLPNSVNNVILSTVLHHIDSDVQVRFLSHIIEVLKEGGRLIVIEDSYPENRTKENVHSQLDWKFHLLSEKQKKDVLSFLDWWGNRFLKNEPGIPIPCTFRTIEQWKQMFTECGLKEVNVQYLGIPEIRAHVMVPKAVLVYEKVNKQTVVLQDSNLIQRAENGELLAFSPCSHCGLILT